MQAQIRPYTYLSKDDIDHLLSVSLRELKQIRDESRLSARKERILFQDIENERLFKFAPEDLSSYFRRGNKLFHTNGKQESEIPQDEVPSALSIYYILEFERSEEINEVRVSRITEIAGGSVYCRHEIVDAECIYCGATREY